MPDLPESDLHIGFIIAGVCLMVIAVLLFIFIEIGVKEGFGLGLLFVIGLGLTVAGSPDPRKENS